MATVADPRDIIVAPVISGMKTTATKKGDKYVINGSKNWITVGPKADAMVLFAMTDKAAGHKGALAGAPHATGRHVAPVQAASAGAPAVCSDQRPASRPPR